jgi:hypothetical protein
VEKMAGRKNFFYEVSPLAVLAPDYDLEKSVKDGIWYGSDDEMMRHV